MQPEKRSSKEENSIQLNSANWLGIVNYKNQLMAFGYHDNGCLLSRVNLEEKEKENYWWPKPAGLQAVRITADQYQTNQVLLLPYPAVQEGSALQARILPSGHAFPDEIKVEMPAFFDTDSFLISMAVLKDEPLTAAVIVKNGILHLQFFDKNGVLKNTLSTQNRQPVTFTEQLPAGLIIRNSCYYFANSENFFQLYPSKRGPGMADYEKAHAGSFIHQIACGPVFNEIHPMVISVTDGYKLVMLEKGDVYISRLFEIGDMPANSLHHIRGDLYLSTQSNKAIILKATAGGIEVVETLHFRERIVCGTGIYERNRFALLFESGLISSHEITPE